MLYEMLAGQLPFDEDTPSALILQLAQDQTIPLRTSHSAIPQSLQKVIMRTLEREPVMRYRDGFSLAYALEQADDKLPPAQKKK